MSDIAQKRDLSEPKTIRDFANTVKSTNRLRLLTVLTVCDIRGVGPDVWNNWKAVMIRTLFSKTINVLKENFEAISRPEQVNHAKSVLRKELIEWSEDKIITEINRHYTGFYLGLTSEIQAVFAELGKNCKTKEIISKIDTDDNRDATRACFLMEDHPGLFSRLAGAIALAGANVIDARTYTTSDGYATAVFWLQSNEGKPFEENRLNRLNRTIKDALKGEIIPRDALKEKGKIRKKEKDFKVPTNITFDNEGSEIYTIIEIDTRDRLGLLHDLARTLANNNVTIVSAIIATYGEQAVDTFYVKDLFGLKLHSEHKRLKLAENIQEAIEAGTLIGTD
jgi:[protein-PII] uridylyltransferase